MGPKFVFEQKYPRDDKKGTLPKTNSSPLKIDPFPKEIPIGNHHFQGLLLLVSGSVFLCKLWQQKWLMTHMLPVCLPHATLFHVISLLVSILPQRSLRTRRTSQSNLSTTLQLLHGVHEYL